MSRKDEETGAVAAGTQRLDKWLWFARLLKSRTMAAGLVSDGRVRVNRQRVDKPSHALHVGDVVTATVHRRVVVAKVLALGQRRGPAVEARLLYEDLSPPPQPETAETAERGGGAAPGPRPDKRERREIAAFKRRDS